MSLIQCEMREGIRNFTVLLRHFKRQTDGLDNKTKLEKCLQNICSEFKLALSIFPEAIIKQ